MIIATDKHTNSTASIVHWRLRGDVHHEKLSAAFAKAPRLGGLIATPATPSPEVALNRAMESIRSRTILTRRIKAATWGIVRESVDAANEKLAHTHTLTIAVDGAGIVRASDPGHELCAPVLAAYNTALDTLTSHDLSNWLTTIMARLSAVPMRTGGGLYYTPPEHSAVVGELREVLSEIGARLYAIPAVKSDDVVQNVLDGLTDEVESLSDELLREVDEIGPKARATRRARLADLTAKVGKYEALMGVKLGELHERAAKARAALVAADMRSMADAAE